MGINRTDFKQTEIGPIPKHWEAVPLEQVLTEVDIRVRDLNDAGTSTFPVLSLTKNQGLILQSERFGKRIATEDVSNYKVVKSKQIVYNPYVIWEGAVHILRDSECGLVSPVYPIWEAKADRADSFFVDHLLRMPFTIGAYNRFAAGAVNRRRSIRKTDFLSIFIPLPPLSEQRAIAHVLRTIQRAKEATENVIAATRQLKQSLMRHLFTYGSVPFGQADRVKLQETELGTVPEQWCRATLGELCAFHDGAIQTGPFGSQLHKADYVDNGVPVVNPTHLLGNRINHVDLPRITTVKASELARHRLRHGDVLFARRGEIGRHGFVTQAEEGWLCATGCFLVRVNHPKIFNAFLPWYFSQTSVVEWLEANAAGAIMPNLNNTTLARLPVFYPTLPEQRQIAAQLAAVDAKLAAEETRRDALDTLFQSLLHHLMTGKVRIHDLELPSMKEEAP